MLLRPATPLTILFFAAFVLLLLSTISTPIVKSIPLASFDGYDFGVFGYCGPDSCSSEKIGYSTGTCGRFSPSKPHHEHSRKLTDDAPLRTDPGDHGGFTLPSNTRHSLSSILIVHPIAALMTLICTILAFCSHFQGPAHSPSYLLALLILSFPTLLITLLAFLVDILLFIPHVAWGGWIVLAATIIITACSLLTCAMRRLLVSRKARKKRIAENAEMNGQTYYETRQEQQFARADSPPPLNDKPVKAAAVVKPQFATFELQRKAVQEDRVPLNAPQAPSPESMSTTGRGNAVASTQNSFNNDVGTPLVPMVLGHPPGREARRKNRRTPPDSPIDGQRPASSPSTMFNRDFPDSRNGQTGRAMGSRPNGSLPIGAPRGRGYPPRGGLPPRGGFPSRGSYGRGAPQGMRGPPPPGWNGNGRGGYPNGPGRGGPMMRGRGGPPPGYANRPYSGPITRQDGRQPIPGQSYGPMNPYTRRISGGSRGPQQNDDGYLTDIPQSPNEERRDGIPAAVEAPNDEYAPGRVFSLYSQPGGGLEHANVNGVEAPRELDGAAKSEQPIDPLAFIFGGPNNGTPADDQRALPHLDTNGLPGQAVEMGATPRSPQAAYNPSSPVEMGDSSSILNRNQASPPRIDHTTSPTELPTTTSAQPTSPTSPRTPPLVHPALRPQSRTASDSYYEDVDPRFAQDEPPLGSPSTIGSLAADNHKPNALLRNTGAGANATSVPGYIARQRHLTPTSNGSHSLPPSIPPPAGFYTDPNAPPEAPEDAEDAASRARSPAASETSNFTSVSQRGVNPNWRPVGGGGPSAYGSQFTARPGGNNGAGAGRWKGEASSSLSILEANPDFMLPGVGGRGTIGRSAAGAGGIGMGGMGMGLAGMRGSGGGRVAGGGGGVGAGGAGSLMRQPAGPGLLGVGRYPTDV